jgi:hypothetical protein
MNYPPSHAEISPRIEFLSPSDTLRWQLIRNSVPAHPPKSITLDPSEKYPILM